MDRLERIISKSSSHTFCSVPQCSNYSEKGRSFHKFPNDKSIEARWAHILKIGKKISSGMLVCSDHFASEDFFYFGPHAVRKRLKKTAIPSKKLPTTTLDKISSKYRNQPTQRKDRSVERKAKLSSAIDGHIRPCAVESDNHRLGMPEENNLALEPPEAARNDEMSAAEALLELHSAVTPETCTSHDVGTQACTEMSIDHKITLLDMIKSDADLNAFTGIHSFQLLNAISETVEMLESSMSKPNNTQLDTTEKIVLTMVKIKLNISFTCIAVLFGISITTCIRYFQNTTPLLSGVLTSAIIWPDKEAILKNIPLCFQNYKDTRVVLDCTETPVEKPSCLKCRLSTYSHYKGQNTIKFLIGVAPEGLITFVSDAYGGRASDKAIFLQSNLMDKLIPYKDAVMADKGFLVEHELTANGIKLIRPPFLGKSKQFSVADGRLTADIAQARVHVERSIQRLKVFKILKGQLTWNLVPYIDDIMITAAGIVNLSKPILSLDKF